MMAALPAMRLLRRPLAVALLFAALVFVGAFTRFHDQLLPSATSSDHGHASTTSKFYSTEQDGSTYYSAQTPPFFPPMQGKTFRKADLCADFPVHLLNSVQIILKTGAGEPAKTKAHLATVSSCIPNLLIFSDNEERVGGHRIIDILAHLPDSYKSNPDFAIYSSQKQAYAQGEGVGYSAEGWKLDRFKFLPMVERAYQMRPKADWYVFIETDVYYFWDTLFRLLSQLDSTKMHFMGSPTPGPEGTVFAYGGAGFVLSAGLMASLNEGPVPLSTQFEDNAQTNCCGDSVLSYAILNKTGVGLQALYPTFAGDELIGLKIDRERWCIPLLGLHRVSPQQMSSLWEWERRRPYNKDPFTHSTIADYIFPEIFETPVRTSWDNYADIVQPEDSPAHASVTVCGLSCESDSFCLQYQYSEGVCRFGNFVQLGRQKDGVAITSGWDVKQMALLGYKKSPKKSSSCKKPTWLRPVVH